MLDADDENADDHSPSEEFSIARTGIIDADVMTRGLRVHSGQTYPLLRVMAVILGLVTLGIALLMFVRGDLQGTFIFVLLGGPLLLWSAAADRIRRRSFHAQLREMHKETEEVSYSVTQSYFYIMGDDVVFKVPWSEFTKWKEGAGLILVYRHRAYFNIVPIDQFDAEFNDALHQQLRMHVPS